MAELNARLVAKASATSGEAPLAADLEVAEIAVNTADGKLFTKHTDDSIKEISGSSGGGAVDSVNGETGVVSLGIQDMDDYALVVGSVYRYAGGREPDGSGTPGDPGEWGASNLRWNNEDSDGNTWTTAGSVSELWVSENGITWQDLGSQSISTFSNTYFISNSSGLTPTFAGWTTLYLATSNPVSPLADGDILQWNDADQKFNPAQLPDVIDKATLQSELAAATDFADFQSRIAAL